MLLCFRPDGGAAPAPSALGDAAISVPLLLNLDGNYLPRASLQFRTSPQSETPDAPVVTNRGKMYQAIAGLLVGMLLVVGLAFYRVRKNHKDALAVLLLVSLII